MCIVSLHCTLCFALIVFCYHVMLSRLLCIVLFVFIFAHSVFWCFVLVLIKLKFALASVSALKSWQLQSAGHKYFFELYRNYSYYFCIIYLHNIHVHVLLRTLLKESLDSKIKKHSTMKLHGVAKFNTYRCINSMYSAVHVNSLCFHKYKLL